MPAAWLRSRIIFWHASTGAEEQFFQPPPRSVIAASDDEVQPRVDQVASRAVDGGHGTGDTTEHVGNAEGGVDEVDARRRGKSADGEAG